HAVSALERGERRRPHVETVRALSAALDLSGAPRDAFVWSARATADNTAADELSGASLPMALTALVGRERDVHELRDWLGDPAVRLITLTGPGGVGKTRLALDIARSVATEGLVRVKFVPLAAILEPALVAPAIAEAVGLADATPLDLPKRLRIACADQPTLFVLDNFEQVLEAASLVADLLSSVASLRLLVTSRASLRVRGEREYAVGPLELEAGSEAMSPEDLARSPAIRLFVERVREVQPDFHLTATNGPAVAALCRRLDALPLALELAAPWMKVLTVENLLGRFGRDVPPPTAAPRDLPERQQTMNATVAWSYQLLDRDEQRAFRRFGALPGPFPIDAAASVLAGRGGASDGSDEALRAAAGLIDKSLLVRAATSAVPTYPQYQMLETVRAYAALELTAAGERDDAMEGLARYTTAEASLAAEGLRGPGQVEWLDRVREHLESYRATLTWLIEGGRFAEACDIAWSLLFFWAIRGHAAEGLAWYEQILKRPGLPPAVESTALLGAGVMRYLQGEVGHARTALALALALAHDTGDMAIVAQAENLLGRVEHSLGHLDTAREHYAHSIELFRAVALPWGLGNSLTGMATVHLATGDPTSAERLLDEATSVLRSAGPWFLALTLHIRAVIAMRRGHADDTIAIVRESLTLIRALHDKYAFVYALGPLAAAAVIKGDDVWAARILGARDAVTERTGVTVVVRRSLDDLIGLGERELRARLGPARWARAYAAGRRISIDALLNDIDAVLPRGAHRDRRVD
ncbi:MAG: transcriptional regulator, family, partial [candidate division NC10 bacterium]|nr:transcriptional regulator, family [candidate division NC10 bacterium]